MQSWKDNPLEEGEEFEIDAFGIVLDNFDDADDVYEEGSKQKNDFDTIFDAIDSFFSSFFGNDEEDERENEINRDNDRDDDRWIEVSQSPRFH